jgi:hypothetical protein
MDLAQTVCFRNVGAGHASVGLSEHVKGFFLAVGLH